MGLSLDEERIHMRTRNLYDPLSSKPFKLSRSRLENFIRCPRCFYIDRRLGVEPPPGYPFNLNSAVDTLLKKEFDLYRVKKVPHPLMKDFGVDAIPFAHPDLNIWRENFKGVQFLHEPSNLLITGAIDDVWINPDEELIIVDYKATSKNGEITLDDAWKIGYKRQMEIYQWLFRRNGFNVAKTGYFVYCNGLKGEAEFGDCLKFKTKLLPYVGDDSWIDKCISDAHTCLNSDIPPNIKEGCGFCMYLEDVTSLRV